MSAFGDSYLNRIRRRLLYQNKNWIGILCGETGSGKSYSALALADAISPRGITVKRNVVFNPKQFLERINSGWLKKGDVLVFDEAGVGMSSREWYSVQNKLLGTVLQTFRNMNVGLLFTTPNLSFMDVQGRKLLHSYYETMWIDYERERAIIKVYDIQHNSRLDKTYFKHPRFINEHGCKVRVSRLAIPKPRDDLIKEYEAVKQSYTEELNRSALEGLDGKKKQSRTTDFERDKEIAAELVKKKARYRRSYGKREYLDHALVMQDYGLAHNRALRIKKTAERMLGYASEQ